MVNTYTVNVIPRYLNITATSYTITFPISGTIIEMEDYSNKGLMTNLEKSIQRHKESIKHLRNKKRLKY